MSVLLTAFLLAQQAPVAPVAPAAPVPPAAPAKPVKEKKICKSTEDSGSRFVKRVCKTESEWAGGGLEASKGNSRSTVSSRQRD